MRAEINIFQSGKNFDVVDLYSDDGKIIGWVFVSKLTGIVKIHSYPNDLIYEIKSKEDL